MSVSKSKGSKKQPILAGISPKRLPEPGRLVFNRTSQLIAQLNLKKKIKVAILLRHSPLSSYKELKKAVTTYLGQDNKEVSLSPLLTTDINLDLFAKLLAMQPRSALSGSEWLDFLDYEDNSPLMLFLRDLVGRPQVLAKMHMRDASHTEADNSKTREEKIEEVTEAKESNKKKEAEAQQALEDKTDIIQLIRRAVQIGSQEDSFLENNTTTEVSDTKKSKRTKLTPRKGSNNQTLNSTAKLATLTKGLAKSRAADSNSASYFASQNSTLPSLIFTADHPAIFDNPQHSALDSLNSAAITKDALSLAGIEQEVKNNNLDPISSTSNSANSATNNSNSSNPPASPLLVTDLLAPQEDPYPSFFISFADPYITNEDYRDSEADTEVAQLILPEEREEFNIDDRDLEELLTSN